jgi:uncharacterized protein (DUF58 family)
MKTKEGVPVYTFLFDTYFLKLFLPLAIVLLVYIPYKPMMIIIIVYLLYTSYIHFYAKRIAQQVYIDREKKNIRLFLNEIDELEIEIHNDAPMTIAQGKLYFIVNKHIEILESGFLQKSLDETRYTLHFDQEGKTVYKIKIPFKAKARGVYYIEDLDLIIYDFFGSSSVHFPPISQGNTEIIVYPEQLNIKNLSALYLNRIGEEEVPHSYMSDETSVVGIKPYENDSFRHIHWKATAKMQSMYAKQYQHITDKRYTIMLCVTDRNGFTIHKMGEKLISHTAFLCNYLSKKGFSYELYVNYTTKEGVFKLPLNTGIRHLQRTLETLARIQDGFQFIREDHFVSMANTNREIFNEMIYINGEQPPIMSLGASYFYIGAEGELRRVGGKVKKPD